MSCHTHLRQTEECNNFYPIRLAVTQLTRARRATSHTHLRQTDERNNFYPIRLAVTQPAPILRPQPMPMAMAMAHDDRILLPIDIHRPLN